MMTEQRLQEIEAQHQRGLLHRADIDDLIVEARRLKQEMVKCQDIWSTTIAEGMESITELQQQRDAALAERDALYTAQMKQIDYSVQLQRLIESLSRDGDVPYPELHHHQKIVDAKAALTEARRVLRAQDECMVCKAELFRDLTVPHCFDCVVDDDHAEEWDAICAAKAAVLAQEEPS